MARFAIGLGQQAVDFMEKFDTRLQIPPSLTDHNRCAMPGPATSGDLDWHVHDGNRGAVKSCRPNT